MGSTIETLYERTGELIELECPIKISQHSTMGMTRGSWLAFRDRGIGGSEAGAVLDVNSYTSPLELFSHKSGLKKTDRYENYHMSIGKLLEPLVADMWQFLPPGEDDNDVLHYNMRNNNVIRKMYDAKSYVTNDKYPFLFASPDRLFLHQGKLAILEIKTIDFGLFHSHGGDVPDQYYVQIHVYMLVMGLDYGEIAVLVGGKKLVVIPVYRDDELCKLILHECRIFWNRVLKARELIAEGNPEEAKKYLPEAGETKASYDFLNKIYTPVDKRKKFTKKMIVATSSYLFYKEKAKACEELAIAQANIIKDYMGEAEKMYNKDYYVSWKLTKSGQRRFVVKDFELEK